jgi:hypothetical protein
LQASPHRSATPYNRLRQHELIEDTAFESDSYKLADVSFPRDLSAHYRMLLKTPFGSIRHFLWSAGRSSSPRPAPHRGPLAHIFSKIELRLSDSLSQWQSGINWQLLTRSLPWLMQVNFCRPPSAKRQRGEHYGHERFRTYLTEAGLTPLAT